METNPEGTAQTYIFLVDNQDIALNIVMSGYQALCLVQEDDGYYFSADSFIEEMRAIQFTGSCQSAYHYVTACTVKWMNDKLQTFFKDAGLDGKAGWQLFKEKEYLGKLDNQKEVEKLLEQYILRFERDPREEPELSRFHLFDAKGNVKGVRDMEIVDYLVENMKNQEIHVGGQLVYYEGDEGYCFHDSETKTDAGIRDIPMTQMVYDAFRKQRELNLMLGLQSNVEIGGRSGFIFNTKHGRPIMPAGVNSFLKNIVNAYNKKESKLAEEEKREPELMPPISSHTLRHTGCTRLGENNVNPKVMQYVMGHSDAQITMNVYNHIAEKSHVENEMSKMNLPETVPAVV